LPCELPHYRLDRKSRALCNGPGDRGVVDAVDIEGWRADATDVWPEIVNSDGCVLRLEGPSAVSKPADDDHKIARLRKDCKGDRVGAVRLILATHGEAAVIMEDML